MSNVVNSVRQANRDARQNAKVQAVKAFNETYADIVASAQGTDEEVNFSSVTEAVAAYQAAYKLARGEKVVAGQVSEEVAA